MVCTSEQYASEVEIFTFGRGFRTRVSRSSVTKKAFSPVNDQAVWADRRFQQNRPKPDAHHERLKLESLIDWPTRTAPINPAFATLSPVGLAKTLAL